MLYATKNLIRPVATLLLLGLLATFSLAQSIEEQEEKAIRAAVARVAPSVVSIETLGGLEKVGKVLVGVGPTTGLIVSSDGYILSSAFNFIQMPTAILVEIPGSEKRLPAKIVARDQSRMLVLLKVEAEEALPVPATVGRGELKPGQWSVAVGRTFEQEEPNISVGVISAVNRVWGKAIQTDAKISPHNYGGPLVDLYGRVSGILVPLSPNAEGEVAGAEWYDSGIGFAVPIEEVLAKLDTLKSGKDLQKGLLGIAMKGKDQFADEVIIASAQSNSPAAKAGLAKDDKIIEVNGQPIVRQAQLKHAIGGQYAGDKVNIVVMRGDKKLDFVVELAGELKPYEHPFLGILPKRDSERGSAVVRYVYPGSPAEKAGIQAGDALTKLAGDPIPDGPTLQDLLAAYEPNNEVAISFTRNGQEQQVKATLAALPADLPGELPPAHAAVEVPEERPPVRTIEVNVPEEANVCQAFVPETYHPDIPHGLVVWLHGAGGGPAMEELVKLWQPVCEKHDLILLAPKSADPQKWEPTEVDFIRKTMESVMTTYHIDRTRIAAHGYEAGGAMSYLVAFKHQDLIRAVASVDAPLPARAVPPGTDAVYRLAILNISAKDSKVAPQIAAGLKKLTEMKYPVSRIEPESTGPLSEEQRAQLANWLDALDRS